MEVESTAVAGPVNFSRAEPFFPLDPLKHCACGRSISPDSWGRLRLVGTADNGRGIGELLELRSCTCGSTISKPIGEHRPSSTNVPVAERS